MRRDMIRLVLTWSPWHWPHCDILTGTMYFA